MPLSKVQRGKLRDDGWSTSDIKALEARLEDEPDDDDDEPDDDDKPAKGKVKGNGGRVMVAEGSAADKLLAALGVGKGSSDDDDEADDDDKPKPKRRRGYFDE